MFDKPTATFPLGLEQDGKVLRGALLTHNKGQVVIERLFEVPLELTDEGVCLLAPLQSLSPPLPRDRMRRALFITGLSTEQTLIRPLDVKLTKVRDIDAVLNFQAEPLIPYPIENAIIDRWILGTDGDTTHLSVLSVRKDHLQEHLRFYESIKIQPEVVSCYPAALATFCRYFTEHTGPAFVIHLAHKTLSFLLVEDGKVVAAYSVPGGSEPLLKAMKGLSKEQIAAVDYNTLAKGSPLSEAVDTLHQVLTRALFALTKQSRSKEVNSLLITGEGANSGNLPAHLAQVLKKELIKAVPPPNSSVTPQALLTYAVPIGEAYSALPLPASREQINFRRGEFAYPNPWRRLKKPVSIYISCCVFLAIAIALIGHAVLAYQDHRVKEEYATLLQMMEKNHRSFEIEMQGKAPTPELLAEPPPIELKNLTPEQLDARLSSLQRIIDSTPDIFPLQPDVPKVSDVLAWVSNHPKAVKVDPSTGARTPLLQIETFNYTMTKRPDKTKPKERYQVKVELEFTSPDPQSARGFYDALIEPNEIVDSRGEVSWSAGQGKYRTAFFLKDNTVYP